LRLLNAHVNASFWKRRRRQLHHNIVAQLLNKYDNNFFILACSVFFRNSDFGCDTLKRDTIVLTAESKPSNISYIPYDWILDLLCLHSIPIPRKSSYFSFFRKSDSGICQRIHDVPAFYLLFILISFKKNKKKKKKKIFHAR
jgi:hypothetical protein